MKSKPKWSGQKEDIVLKIEIVKGIKVSVNAVRFAFKGC
jgi:hypothetical protein